MNLNSEGIIGLALGNRSGEGKLYVESLKEAGAIDKKEYAFLVSAEGHAKSKVTFGGTELEKYAKGPMHWHNIPDHTDMWDIDIEAVSFEGVHLLEANPEPALVDTGTSYVSLPTDSITKIQRVLMSRYGFGSPRKNHTGNQEHLCGAENYALVPSLKFIMNGITYNLPKDAWLPRREGKCMLQIMNSHNRSVVFGINWFNTYYSAFDMENRRVGFAESIYSNLTEKESKQFNAHVLTNLSEVDRADYLVETNNGSTIESETVTMILIIGSVLVLAAALYRYCKAQQKKNMAIDLEKIYNTFAKSNTRIENDDETFEVPLNDNFHVNERMNSSFVTDYSLNTTTNFWTPPNIGETELEKKCLSVGDSLSETSEEDLCEFGIGSLDD